MNKKGIVLLASIMLIVFASVAILSVTTFIIQRIAQEQVYQLRVKCIYLSQAGVHNAIYWYRYNDLSANGCFSLGKTNIDANNFFVLGATDADLLMVNTSNSSIGGVGNRDLLGLTMQNATNSKTITIDRVIVTWNNAAQLQQIRINGTNVFTGGNLSSPANVNISNFQLNTTPTIYNINRIRFNGSMIGTTISIQFVMTDGSGKGLAVYPASSDYSFTVKSTGKTVGSNIYRSIQADYNALTGKITNYNEINAEITP